VTWADHAQATSIASVEHFSCDEPGFYRLANADVVRYEHPHRVELQRHDERHELVGTWILRVGRFQRCLQNTSMIPVPMEV